VIPASKLEPPTWYPWPRLQRGDGDAPVGQLARKLARPDRDYVELWDLTDLLGLRVITYFEDDVDRVGAIASSSRFATS
jgi:hypothetical protein